MFTFKQINKINWNEAKYKQTLYPDELEVYKSLKRNKKELVVWEWLEGRPFNLLNSNHIKEIDEIIEEQNLKVEQEKEEKEYERIINFFTTQGIYQPSDTTIESFKKQQITANFDNFYHALGQFTFNMEKQATYNYYMSQQKQNFIQIAQNDKIIKQNEEIINLLSKIANKGD